MEPHKEYFKAYYSGINPIDFINEYDILPPFSGAFKAS